MIKDKKIYVFCIFTLLFLGLCFYNYGFGMDFVKYLILTGFLAYFSVVDINKRIICNKGLLVMLGVSIMAILSTKSMSACKLSFISGISIFLIMLLMYFISMRRLGFGDVKLFSVIAFLIGFSDTVQLIFMTLVLTVIIGIFIGIYKKEGLKMELPMVPFAFFAMIVNNFLILIFK